MCCASPNTLRFCRRVVCALCDVLQQSAVKTSGRSELRGCASFAHAIRYFILLGFCAGLRAPACGALRFEHAAQRQQQALPVCKIQTGEIYYSGAAAALLYLLRRASF